MTDDVTRVDFSERPFKLYVGDDEYAARTVIVATGATARQLGLESERAIHRRGVTYCAAPATARFTATARSLSSAAETLRWRRRSS